MGGESDFTPAFDLLEQDGFEGVVVAITDGAITVPALKPEHLRGVLWALHRGCSAPAPWGDSVVLDRKRKK